MVAKIRYFNHRTLPSTKAAVAMEIGGIDTWQLLPVVWIFSIFSIHQTQNPHKVWGSRRGGWSTLAPHWRSLAASAPRPESFFMWCFIQLRCLVPFDSLYLPLYLNWLLRQHNSFTFNQVWFFFWLLLRRRLAGRTRAPQQDQILLANQCASSN